MKTKNSYYAISETDNNNLNMGVAVVKSYEECYQKITTICESHFDSDIQIVNFSEEMYNEVSSGKSLDLEVVTGCDETLERITIVLTWLY